MTLFPSDPTPEQWGRARPISFAIWIGYIALFGIAVETGVVMVVYLRDALQQRFKVPGLIEADSDSAAIEGAVQRLRPKLMTVVAVLASLAPILWETGIGSDVMKPIAAPIVGGMITSTIHVLILVFSSWESRRGHLDAERCLCREDASRVIPSTGARAICRKLEPWRAIMLFSVFDTTNSNAGHHPSYSADSSPNNRMDER